MSGATSRFARTYLLYPTTRELSGILVRLLDASGTRAHDLEFDRLAVDFNSTNLKVHAYRTEVAFRVGVLSEPKEQTRLGSKTFSLLGRRCVERRTFPTPESPMRRSLKR